VNVFSTDCAGREHRRHDPDPPTLFDLAKQLQPSICILMMPPQPLSPGEFAAIER